MKKAMQMLIFGLGILAISFTTGFLQGKDYQEKVLKSRYGQRIDNWFEEYAAQELKDYIFKGIPFTICDGDSTCNHPDRVEE